MKRLLFIALFLSFVGPSFAVDDTAEERAATDSKRPKTLRNSPRNIALLSAEGRSASILGNGYLADISSYSSDHFADVRSATTPIGELAHTYKVKGDNPGTTKGGRIARVTRKLLVGAGTSIVTTFVVALGQFEWCDDNMPEDCGELTREEKGAWVLVPISVAMGVSASDQRDRFIYPLAASLLGFGLGITYSDDWFTPLWLPILTATAASEWSRSRVNSRRYSIGLRPEPGGGLSAVAALRFQ